MRQTTGLLAAVALAGLANDARAATPSAWTEWHAPTQGYVGMLSCASASCHGGGQSRSGPPGQLMQESLMFLGGQAHPADPHARSGERMRQAPFQEVLRRASHKADGSVDSSMAARCAACHDPGAVQAHLGGLSLTPAGALTAAGAATPESLMVGQGVGCESCHGPAEKWLAAHYRWDISRDELRQLGMIDTKNIFLRAQICAACHVGSAEQDVNHDMLAAGHPPLRFEMASYQALLGTKHWNDGPRRAAEPNYEWQLWAAGRIASADAALTLLESRARKAAAPGTPGEANPHPWPEFAEQNCFTCHQSLRTAAGPAATPGAITLAGGVPLWRSWNVLLAGAVVSPGAAGIAPGAAGIAPGAASAGDLPAPGTLFEQQLNGVRDEMQRTAFPDADKVTRLAAEARASLRMQAQIAPDGTILNAGGGPLGFEGFLAVASSGPDRHVSWEYCCQQLGAWLAAERSLRDSLAIPQRGAVVPVEALGHLNMLRGRARRVGESLRFITSGREWPRALAALQPGGSVAENTLSLEQAALELEALWRELGNP